MTESNSMTDKAVLLGRNQIFPAHDFELLIQNERYDEKVQRHAHVYYEILLIRSGFAFFCCRKSVSMVLPGDLIVIWPCVSHSLLQCCGLEVTECSFSQTFLRMYEREFAQYEMIRRLFLPGDAMWFRSSAAGNARYGKWMDAMLREQTEKQTGWKENIRMLFGQMLVQFEREEKEECEKTASSMDSLAVVKKVLSAMEAYAGGDINAGFLADQTGFNVDYMTRSFKKLTGLTPMEYFRASRMRKAYELLAEEERPVADVARQLGFENVSNFSRQFKQIMGMTPSAVQAQRRENDANEV